MVRSDFFLVNNHLDEYLNHTLSAMGKRLVHRLFASSASHVDIGKPVSAAPQNTFFTGITCI